LGKYVVTVVIIASVSLDTYLEARVAAVGHVVISERAIVEVEVTVVADIPSGQMEIGTPATPIYDGRPDTPQNSELARLLRA
jgi:UDP-3-O-[3-hydroxymyristoyl] glucosamine N-acyltransferase